MKPKDFREGKNTWIGVAIFLLFLGFFIMILLSAGEWVQRTYYP